MAKKNEFKHTHFNINFGKGGEKCFCGAERTYSEKNNGEVNTKWEILHKNHTSTNRTDSDTDYCECGAYRNPEYGSHGRIFLGWGPWREPRIVQLFLDLENNIKRFKETDDSFFIVNIFESFVKIIKHEDRLLAKQDKLKVNIEEIKIILDKMR